MGLTYQDYHDPDGCGLRQKDLTVRQSYDRAYLAQRYEHIDGNVRELACQRVKVLNAFVGWRERNRLLDFGCGTGRVVEAAECCAEWWDAYGHDVVRWDPGPDPVHNWGSVRYVDDPAAGGPWDVATFFDSLEHLPDPAAVVRGLAARWVMVSVPWCHFPGVPDWFMGWKHRRPGEHLWHWHPVTLDAFFRRLGYRPVMHSSYEDTYRPNPDQAEPNILSALYVKRT